MRINQCYISKSVHDFPFCRLYNLAPYYDSVRPCVFFGCYDDEDFQAIRNHKGLAVIWWCGQDARDFTKWSALDKINIFHVTERLKVFEHVKEKGVRIKLNKCSNLAEPSPITQLGNKIFAYCPNSYPEYHGIDILRELRNTIDFEIILGDGSIHQDAWRKGMCNAYYNQCFVGLVLSPFAGGGATVIELGLRGRKCITNVVELGNVIRWTDVDSIRTAINEQAKNIGMYKTQTVCDTLKSIDFTNKFLNTDEYEIL